jgi:hypothetical protein
MTGFERMSLIVVRHSYIYCAILTAAAFCIWNAGVGWLKNIVHTIMVNKWAAEAE